MAFNLPVWVLPFFIRFFALCALITVLDVNAALAASAPSPASKAESMDELYEKVKKEGGQLTLYIALSARSEEVILPIFRKRFPAIQVNHIDATSDKLVARALAEARGGRVIGDVFGGTPGYLAQMSEQKLLASLALPEAAVYPATHRAQSGSQPTHSFSSPDGIRVW